MIQHLYFIHLVFYTPKPVKKSKHKISPLKLHEKFVNKIVNDDDNDALIDLNDFNKKEVLENENPDKVIDIVEKTSLL